MSRWLRIGYPEKCPSLLAKVSANENYKNTNQRYSIMVEKDGTMVTIDTS